MRTRTYTFTGAGENSAEEGYVTFEKMKIVGGKSPKGPRRGQDLGL